MNKLLENIFPETIRKGAIEVFGKQSIQPVLLGLLTAPPIDTHLLSASCLGKMLHPNETAILNGYKFPKRRSEYLTGRICAKMAIQGFLNLSNMHHPPLRLSEIEISNTENRRPVIYIHTANTDVPRMDISISHSGNYGVALVTEYQCGIDLQRQETTLLRVQEKYCSSGEYRFLENFLASNDKKTKLTILWAAKEAAKKALSQWQMPGFLDMEIRSLEKYSRDCIVLSLKITQDKSQQLPEEVTVVAGVFSNYALAICLVSEEFRNA